MKEYSAHISKPAEQDISRAVEYIDSILHNPPAADAFLDAIEEAFSSVTFFPSMFPLVKDPILAAHGIRLQNIKNYLALYTVDEGSGTVHIVRFLHGKSNWQAILKSDLAL